MTDFLVRLRRAVLGLSAAMLVVALVGEAPSRILADDYYYSGPCPNPKAPTGCGTPGGPTGCNGNDCTAKGGSTVCGCTTDISVCPCVQS